MIAVHKFLVPLLSAVIGTVVPVKMPEGAQILSTGFVPVELGSSTYEPCFWAEVDTEAPMTMRVFRLYATGAKHEDPAKEIFVGTVVIAGPDTLIFHIYEVIQ